MVEPAPALGFGLRPSDFGVPTADCGPWTVDFCTYVAYAHNVRRKKKVLRTSFRSATHATDSTWSG
jgi:hypothetical protein